MYVRRHQAMLSSIEHLPWNMGMALYLMGISFQIPISTQSLSNFRPSNYRNSIPQALCSERPCITYTNILHLVPVESLYPYLTRAIRRERIITAPWLPSKASIQANRDLPRSRQETSSRGTSMHGLSHSCTLLPHIMEARTRL